MGFYMLKNIQKISDEIFNTFTDEEKKNLGYYSTVGYEFINTMVQDQGFHVDYTDMLEDEELKEDPYTYNMIKDIIFVQGIIRSLDKITNQDMLEEKVTLYKGTSFEHFINYKVGDIISLPLYTSTTLSKNISTSFMKFANEPVLLEIEADKGTKGYYIGTNTSNKSGDEEEFLLPRETLFEIVDMKNESIKLKINKQKGQFYGEKRKTYTSCYISNLNDSNYSIFNGRNV